MAQRTCTLDGCGRKHVARGLCSTHYNQTKPKGVRHRKVTVACVVCGIIVERRADAVTRYQPTCSVACRNVVAIGITDGESYDWAKDACSRARKNGASVVRPFDRTQVFERDGWTCCSCGVTCTAPDPFVLTSATVDHVVPYASGGEHTLENAQTLCLSCNSAKQDRLAA